MSEVHRVSVEIGGTEISFETGKPGQAGLRRRPRHARATRVVLGTATAGNLRDVDFLPLTVDVEERMYAAGKIPGSFFKREGRAGEKATLIARMIDRPLRPLFPKGWRYETQLVVDPAVGRPRPPVRHPRHERRVRRAAWSPTSRSRRPSAPCASARSRATSSSTRPRRQLLESDLDLVVAGTDEAILMVEAGANEIPEAEILDALDIAHGEIKKLVRRPARAGREGRQAQARDRRAAGRRGPARARSQSRTAPRSTRRPRSRTSSSARTRPRRSRRRSLDAVLGRPATPRPTPSTAPRAQLAFDTLEKRIIRERIAVHKKRPDGRADERDPADRRSRSGSLPRTHGSALFTRGQTQALSVVALGTTREEMRLDNLGLETSKRYFHHYNFPPFSVGEAGFMRGPKRRDIGHGALAERALVPMIPSQEDVPVHDPRRVGHPRVQRLVVDGLGVRLDAVADGRRRADQGARWPASPWA